ncbi:MAG: hypothetical protein WAM39_32715 [Bryobacteraceae bacterium]
MANGAFVDLALIVPALLLFQDFYGRDWRSSVRWLIGSYAAFATFAYTQILIEKRPDLFGKVGASSPDRLLACAARPNS